MSCILCCSGRSAFLFCLRSTSFFVWLNNSNCFSWKMIKFSWNFLNTFHSISFYIKPFTYSTMKWKMVDPCEMQRHIIFSWSALIRVWVVWILLLLSQNQAIYNQLNQAETFFANERQSLKQVWENKCRIRRRPTITYVVRSIIIMSRIHFHLVPFIPSPPNNRISNMHESKCGLEMLSPAKLYAELSKKITTVNSLNGIAALHWFFRRGICIYNRCAHSDRIDVN